MTLWLSHGFTKHEAEQYEEKFAYVVQESTIWLKKFDVGLNKGYDVLRIADNLLNLIDLQTLKLFNEITNDILNQNDEQKLWVEGDNKATEGYLASACSPNQSQEFIKIFRLIKAGIPSLFDSRRFLKIEVLQKLQNMNQILVDVNVTDLNTVNDEFQTKTFWIDTLIEFFGKAIELDVEVIFD